MCGEFLNQAAGREVIPQGSPLNGGIGAARDKLFGALRGHGVGGPIMDFFQHGMGGGMPQAPGATGAPNPLRSLFPQFGGNPQTPQAAQSPSIPLGVGKGPFG